MLYFSRLLTNKRCFLIKENREDLSGLSSLQKLCWQQRENLRRQTRQRKEKLCQKEKAELFGRGVKAYGVCTVHGHAGGSGMSPGCYRNSQRPQGEHG